MGNASPVNPRILCFSCALVVESKGNEPETCPRCDSKLKTQNYDRLIDYAHGAVRYGYRYRKRHKNLLPDSLSSSPAFFLSGSSQVLEFLGTAVLGGIVTNISWAVLKTIMRSIVASDAALNGGIPDSEAQSIIEDDRSLQEFYSFIRDYVNKFENVEPVLKDALIEERVVSLMAEIIEAALSESQDISPARIRAITTKVKERVIEETRPLTEADYQEMWQKIDLSG